MSEHLDEMLEIKRQLYEHCQRYIHDLIESLERGISKTQDEANREEKSSAGDKFETHRAMMHLEMESLITQREVAVQTERALSFVNLAPASEVRPGSLIKLERGWYFIGISAPPITINQTRYSCLAMDAPIYLSLRGLHASDWAEWTDPGGGEDLIEVIELY